MHHSCLGLLHDAKDNPIWLIFYLRNSPPNHLHVLLSHCNHNPCWVRQLSVCNLIEVLDCKYCVGQMSEQVALHKRNYRMFYNCPGANWQHGAYCIHNIMINSRSTFHNMLIWVNIFIHRYHRQASFLTLLNSCPLLADTEKAILMVYTFWWPEIHKTCYDMQGWRRRWSFSQGYK